jgi:protein-tyrosine phosphatase
MLFDFNEIKAGRLWVGSFVGHHDVKQLWRMGITTVISLQSDQDIKGCGINTKKLLKALTEADMEFLRVPVPDFNEEALGVELPVCIKELETALAQGWAKVYLHCTAGVNRSPTVAAAYLMKSRGWTAQHAYDYLTEKRNCKPYLKILQNYEEALNGEMREGKGYRLHAVER